jgi:lipooligosaccharide transport system ATP-binding protein
MDHGSIVAEGSPWELIRRYSTREVVEVRFDDERPQNGVFDTAAERIEDLPDRVLLYTQDGDATAAAIADRGLPPHSTLIRRSTLEDVFLHLTGRTLVD